MFWRVLTLVWRFSTLAWRFSTLAWRFSTLAYDPNFGMALRPNPKTAESGQQGGRRGSFAISAHLHQGDLAFFQVIGHIVVGIPQLDLPGKLSIELCCRMTSMPMFW